MAFLNSRRDFFPSPGIEQKYTLSIYGDPWERFTPSIVEDQPGCIGFIGTFINSVSVYVSVCVCKEITEIQTVIRIKKGITQ